MQAGLLLAKKVKSIKKRANVWWLIFKTKWKQYLSVSSDADTNLTLSMKIYKDHIREFFLTDRFSHNSKLTYQSVTIGVFSYLVVRLIAKQFGCSK